MSFVIAIVVLLAIFGVALYVKRKSDREDAAFVEELEREIFGAPMSLSVSIPVVSETTTAAPVKVTKKETKPAAKKAPAKKASKKSKKTA